MVTLLPLMLGVCSMHRPVASAVLPCLHACILWTMTGTTDSDVCCAVLVLQDPRSRAPRRGRHRGPRGPGALHDEHSVFAAAMRVAGA